mmetsp:Transcript_3879/g.11037  ORF Transcript_3879/g.11037 Transcript_3879/m.11037 type:complete len:224 (-) Transcript_3879:2600-3271(-)
MGGRSLTASLKASIATSGRPAQGGQGHYILKQAPLGHQTYPSVTTYHTHTVLTPPSRADGGRAALLVVPVASAVRCHHGFLPHTTSSFLSLRPLVPRRSTTASRTRAGSIEASLPSKFQFKPASLSNLSRRRLPFQTSIQASLFSRVQTNQSFLPKHHTPAHAQQYQVRGTSRQPDLVCAKNASERRAARLACGEPPPPNTPPHPASTCGFRAAPGLHAAAAV